MAQVRSVVILLLMVIGLAMSAASPRGPYAHPVEKRAAEKLAEEAEGLVEKAEDLVEEAVEESAEEAAEETREETAEELAEEEEESEKAAEAEDSPTHVVAMRGGKSNAEKPADEACAEGQIHLKIHLGADEYKGCVTNAGVLERVLPAAKKVPPFEF